MSDWRSLYGFEPTRDAEEIQRMVAEFGSVGVVLNELPLDGPIHPATAYSRAGHSVIVCEGTGRRIVSDLPGHPDAAMMATVVSWGCTYLALDLGEEDA